MAKNLVIVESPAKAKTIEGFLGKDFIVRSCNGHIRDLAKGNDAVDIKNSYKPVYEIADEKKGLVNELKKMAKESEVVWLASDEDREGEAISWHLSEVLGLKKDNTRRIVFHEITKPAIMKAIENPRGINIDMVNAQQARRVLDRLVGFEISPILWKKVKPSLSAGRVQSVAVRLIVEREREINEFQSSSQFRVTAEFIASGKTIKAELPQRFDTRAEAEKFLNDCLGAEYTVRKIEVKPAKRTPAAPFTTSTLQQEASRKLGYSVAQTMRVAQKLYESGFITYMRTDSVNLSEFALESAKKEINKAFGEKYSQTRKYATKSSGAQEAHEAIRPTYFENHSIDGDRQEKALYDLIWKRAIASQMSDAILEKTQINIGISGKNSGNTGKQDFIASGEVIKFDGFLKVYIESHDDDATDEENSGLLPKVNEGDKLELGQIQATQRFARPAPRYTEASLVKKLEELGIGRPSTYAPTISTIIQRGYVVKEDREGKSRNYDQLTLKNDQIKAETKSEVYGAEKAKLFPSDIGTVVTDFLIKHFGSIMDYGFTASVEKEFDDIAHGMKEWTRMIDSFYKPFHKTVDKTLESAERATGERVLGVDPKTGKNVIARIGRFGPMVQIGDKDDPELKYASLRHGQLIESITLDEALELFKLPKTVGEFEGNEMKVAIGRYGPYVAHDGKFYSVPKSVDPLEVDHDKAIEIIKEQRENSGDRIAGTFEGKDMKLGKGRFGPYVAHDGKYYSIPRGLTFADVTEAKAIEIIQKKRETDANKVIKTFPEDKDMQLLNGRYGPYLAHGKNNYKLPKDVDPASLSYEDCKKIMGADAGTAKKGKAGAAKKSTKTTTRASSSKSTKSTKSSKKVVKKKN